jgi:hypothetical protein
LVPFGKLTDAIAVMRNQSLIAPVMSFIEALHQFTEKPPEPRLDTEPSKGFFSFLAHECFVMFVASFLQHERYEELDLVFTHPIQVKSSYGDYMGDFRALSSPIRLLFYRNDRLKRDRASIQAELLRERHDSGGPLSTVSDFDSFMDADYFIFLRVELPPPKSPMHNHGRPWRAWSSIYLERRVPDFLVRSKSSKYAARVFPALALSSVDEFAERVAERASTIHELWRRTHADFSHLERVQVGDTQ